MTTEEKNTAYMIVDRHRQLFNESNEIEKQLKELTAKLKKIHGDINTVREEEKEFMSKIREKYGEGVIDPATFDYVKIN